MFIYSDYPLCNQQDYLNFYCNTCKKNLCKLHYHHEESCPFVEKKEDNSDKKKIEFNYQIKKCDFCKGDIKNIEPVECELCHGQFCLKCRLEFDHNCPKAVRETTEDIHKRNKDLVKQRMAEMKKKKGKK